MQPVMEKYAAQLVGEGVLTVQQVEAMKKRIWGILEDGFEKAKTYKSNSAEWVSSPWTGELH
jgi:2-oxoglutarate dehydrogenase E1 component